MPNPLRLRRREDAYSNGTRYDGAATNGWRLPCTGARESAIISR